MSFDALMTPFWVIYYCCGDRKASKHWHFVNMVWYDNMHLILMVWRSRPHVRYWFWHLTHLWHKSASWRIVTESNNAIKYEKNVWFRQYGANNFDRLAVKSHLKCWYWHMTHPWRHFVSYNAVTEKLSKHWHLLNTVMCMGNMHPNFMV